MTGALATAVATACGAGYFPIAPGTVGAAAGVALWWGGRALGAGPAAEALVVAVVLVGGAWAATLTERRAGITDPGIVVVDEVLGQCVALLAAPWTWQAALGGFLLFRAFDIAKPPPARQLERLHGGWGIMLDDLAAGVYAWLVLQSALWWAPGWFA